MQNNTAASLCTLLSRKSVVHFQNKIPQLKAVFSLVHKHKHYQNTKTSSVRCYNVAPFAANVSPAKCANYQLVLLACRICLRGSERVWWAVDKSRITVEISSVKTVSLTHMLMFFSANTGITSGNMDQFKTRVILSSDGTNTWWG